jgi:hypothetical protein
MAASTDDANVGHAATGAASTFMTQGYVLLFSSNIVLTAINVFSPMSM